MALSTSHINNMGCHFDYKNNMSMWDRKGGFSNQGPRFRWRIDQWLLSAYLMEVITFDLGVQIEKRDLIGKIET
jgi:hypothetical protein